jgi:hypothetical protein
VQFFTQLVSQCLEYIGIALYTEYILEMYKTCGFWLRLNHALCLWDLQFSLHTVQWTRTGQELCSTNDYMIILVFKACLTLNILGVKKTKKSCDSGSRPTLFFSADPIIFSTRLTVRPYFLRVVAGCCQNGVCCHTNYWKNHEKNIQKKLFPTYRP